MPTTALLSPEDAGGICPLCGQPLADVEPFCIGPHATAEPSTPMSEEDIADLQEEEAREYRNSELEGTSPAADFAFDAARERAFFGRH